MEKKYLIGNWKMYKTVKEAVAFIQQFLPALERIDRGRLELFLAPSFIHLLAMAPFIDSKRPIQLVAQNCHHEAEGAFTGEVSAPMLASIKVSGVLIGHSERRIYQKEDHFLLAKKVKRVLATGMQPFLCCGESLEERKSGKYKAVIHQQIRESLWEIIPEEVEKIAIAYEPIWAIGTGKIASLEYITEMHNFIREFLVKEYGGNKIPILYGGSCNAENAKAIFNAPNVAGGLIGKASLEANQFIQLITILLEKKDDSQ